MKLSNIVKTISVASALLILSIGAASAQTATVKIQEGAELDGYKTAYLAITADAAQGHGFVDLLIRSLASKGLVTNLGFPPKNVPLDGALTLFIQVFEPEVASLQIYAHDSKTEKPLAKITSSGALTLAQQEALANNMMDQLFGEG